MQVMIFGLLLQLIALVLVFRGRSKGYLSYVGVLFVCMAVVFHGLTEIVQLIFPNMNPYRLIIDDAHVYDWMLTVSIGIFLFAVTYVIVLSRFRTHDSMVSDRPVDNMVMDWKIVLTLVAPAFLLSISGVQPDQLGYWVGGLIGDFVVFGIILCSLLCVFRTPKALLLVILTQAVVIALLGRRLEVLVATVILLSGIARHRMKVKRTHVVTAAVVVALIGITISATRATVGRENLNSDAVSRINGLMTGATSLLTAGRTGDGVLRDVVYRFDGNSFGAIVATRINEGVSPPGLSALAPNFALIVPRFLNPHKLDGGEQSTEEESYMTEHYNMPAIDYLPTTLGILFAYYGSLGLFAASVVFGLIFALVDYWLIKRKTTWSFVVAIGLTYSVVFMEQGLRVYFVTFRSIVVLYGVLSLLQVLYRFGRKVLLQVAGRRTMMPRPTIQDR